MAIASYPAEIAGRGRAIYLGIALLRLGADPDPLSITICNTARLLTAGVIRQEVINWSVTIWMRAWPC